MNTHEIAAVCTVAIAAGMSLFATAEAYELDADGRTIIRGVASEVAGTQIDTEAPLADAKELACGDPTSLSCKIAGIAVYGISFILIIGGLVGIKKLIEAMSGILN